MGCRVRGMSTQEYRRSYDYRREYFKKNPGLFGCIWFCSQCYKPLFGKKNVVVDHIRPLNKGGKNHVSNCTAICQKCNWNKSDIVDGRMYKGYLFKFFESNLSRVNRGVGALGVLGFGLTAGAASGVARTGAAAGKGIIRTGGRAGHGIISALFRIIFVLISTVISTVTFPLRKGSILSKLLFLGMYTLAVLYFLTTYTDVLSAWL